MMRRADPVADRALALTLISEALAQRTDVYVPHPGELDWWMFHVDPRHLEPELHLGPRHVAMVDHSTREGFLIGPYAELVAWLEEVLGDGEIEVGWISDRDEATGALLRDRGYAPSSGMPVFELDLTLPNDAERAVPEGVVVRAMAGGAEADSRADAARLAFASTMEPSVHRARYRRFMASPAYSAARDVVAVGADGMVASFAIWWPDHRSGIAQFEPVGTRPDRQGRGLGAAVIRRCLADMRAAGMRVARVCTNDDRDGSIRFYEAVGFTQVDHVTWWTKPDAPAA